MPDQISAASLDARPPRRVSLLGLHTDSLSLAGQSFYRSPSGQVRGFDRKPNSVAPLQAIRFEPKPVKAGTAQNPVMRYRNSPQVFFSYCPAALRPLIIAVRCVSTSPLDVASSPKASPRSGLTFSCCDGGTFRRRNVKTLVRRVILRFPRRMKTADKRGSKLSACTTRQQGRRLFAAPVEQLGKGGDPPLHPPCRYARQAETVPVSAPFGLRGVVAPSSFTEVRR